MKKWGLALGLISILVFSSASAAGAQKIQKGRFVVGAGLGISFQPDNFIQAIAFMGQLTAGYAFDDNFSVFLAAQGHHFFTGPGLVYTKDFFLDLIPTAKIAFGDSKFKPYVTMGTGLHKDFRILSDTPFIYTYLAAQGGLGAQYSADENLDLFIEWKFTEVLNLDNLGNPPDQNQVGMGNNILRYSYMPILVGVNYNL